MPDIVKITDLPAASELAENDYVAVDNPTDGLRKVALGGIISDVKETIDAITDEYYDDILPIDTTANGWELLDTGYCRSNSSYCLVKYVVSPGQVLYIKSDFKFQFQNSASVPSSGTLTRIGETYGAIDGVFVVPDGTTHLIISTTVADSTAAAYHGSAVGEALDNIYEVLRSGKRNILPKRWNRLSISADTGAFASGNTQLTTPHIKVEEGNTIFYTVPTGYYMWALWYGSPSYADFASASEQLGGSGKLVAASEYVIFRLTKTDYGTIDTSAGNAVIAYVYDGVIDRQGIIYTGSGMTSARVNVDTVAKTIDFATGGYCVLLYGARRFNLAGKTLDISSLLNTYGHIYYCYNTDSFYTTDAGSSDKTTLPDDAIYIGSIWNKNFAINLNVYPFFTVNGVKCVKDDARFYNVSTNPDFKIAVLGDSISTYDGISESDLWAVEYPINDVDDVSKMWWEILRKEMRCTTTPTVSAVSRSSYRYQNNALIPAGFDDARIARLGSNGTPSYIFVELGTNDTFSTNLGSLQYTTDSEQLESVKTSIYGGIELTLSKLVASYPNTKIVALLPKLCRTSAISLEMHAKTCEAILDVAKMYGVTVIDLRKCGINLQNVGSYTIDGIHPNAAGMQAMASYIFTELFGY